MAATDLDADDDAKPVQVGPPSGPPARKLLAEAQDLYWKSLQARRFHEDMIAQQDHQCERDPLNRKLGTYLAEVKALEDRLQQVKDLAHEARNQVQWVDNAYRVRCTNVTNERVANDTQVLAAWQFLETHNTGHPGPEPPNNRVKTVTEGASVSTVQHNHGRSVSGLQDHDTSSRVQSPSRNGQAGPSVKDTAQQAQSAATVGEDAPQDNPDETGVEVFDANGVLIGKVRSLDKQNHWITQILKYPIKRKVQIRAKRKFDLEHLETIYEPTDTKGAKWLSCIIQATGEIQAQTCQTCTKNIGVFSDCVIVGGEDFPRCGNCEWNRQGCHGASLTANGAAVPSTSAHPAPQSVVADDEARPLPYSTEPSPPTPESVGRSSSFTAVNGSATVKKPASHSQETASQARAAIRKSLPTGKISRAAPPAQQTPKKRPKAPQKTNSDSVHYGSEPEEADGQLDEAEVDTEEITKDRLLLRDDGVYYTEPELMRGVPLEKISPNHPYWDPDWPPVEDLVKPVLDKWVEKYEQNLTVATSTSSKYLANRQINRGRAILSFLQDGPLHPYQIVGKKWVSKTLVNYDTVFRMVQILEELPKFNLDMTSSQWLRQRLHELYVEQGEDFNLRKTMHNFYHDPKLRHLRQKMGFGNIGRPSGYRMKDKQSTPQKKTPRGKKRKERGLSLDESPQAESGPNPVALQPDVTPNQDDGPAHRKPLQKKQKLLKSTKTYDDAGEDDNAGSSAVSAETRTDDLEDFGSEGDEESDVEEGGESDAVMTEPAPAGDLEYNGFTTDDSYSGDKVYEIDWRVSQVRTKRMTTNDKVTQYFHYVGEPEHRFFEHQVLKTVTPKVQWGIYKDPYDFHLRPAELRLATYASDSLKVIFTSADEMRSDGRGDMIVLFKRERTKRRFLSMLRRKGIHIQKATRAFVEAAWNKLESPVLPMA